jgi:D-3-phosphoglycerate dehydrogenase
VARVLLTYPPHARALYYPEAAQAALRACADVALCERDAGLTGPALVDAARDCTVIVSDRATPAPAALLEALPDLVAFVRCAVDIRNVDVAAASRHGILVTHATAGFAAAVAEWCLGAMIDLARGITTATVAYRRGEMPAAHTGRELRGATLGVIGYGRIARRLCDACEVLGMRVQVCSPHDVVAEPSRLQCDLATLLAAADFVVCLAVATAETENLMDARAFAAMKPSAFFVNASRGELVDEAALAAALDAGRLAGCALDVGRAADQMPSPSLARRADVIATPHVGGLTLPATMHQAMETVAQVADILIGRVPTGAVNADAAHRLRRRSPSAG